ncbi:hypothetical protein AAMO2058_001045800 [Amorphochlora amoebiformis]
MIPLQSRSRRPSNSQIPFRLSSAMSALPPQGALCPLRCRQGDTDFGSDPGSSFECSVSPNVDRGINLTRHSESGVTGKQEKIR